jgi:hypothetical protein
MYPVEIPEPYYIPPAPIAPQYPTDWIADRRFEQRGKEAVAETRPPCRRNGEQYAPDNGHLLNQAR